MSFSRRVKEELIRLPLRPGPENRAEVTALLLGSGRLEINKKGLGLTWEGEIAQIARRLYMMLKEEQPGWTIQIQVSSQIQVGGDSRYRLLLEPGDKVGEFLKELGLVNEDNIPLAGLPWTNIKQETSRRAFLRGYFLARGSISNPESGYYMELLCDREELARDLTVLGDFFDLSLHIRRRRQFWLVYQNRVSEILTFFKCNWCSFYTSGSGKQQDSKRDAELCKQKGKLGDCQSGKNNSGRLGAIRRYQVNSLRTWTFQSAPGTSGYCQVTS